MPRWIHDEINQLLKRLVLLPAVAPGASVGIGRKIGPRWQFVTGCAGWFDTEKSLTIKKESIYDLASLTKPCVAATAARLVDIHCMSWAGRLEQWLPELAGTHAGGATLEQLLSHRSGLQAHIVLDPARLRVGEQAASAVISRAEMIRLAAVAKRPECGPCSGPEVMPVYSDLGYLLAGEAMSRAAGVSLQELVRRHVSLPLGLKLASAAQLLESAETALVVPTEVLAHRGGLVRAQVHDDNAWWLSGPEMSGHAGLFGDALSMARFGAAVVDAVQGCEHSWLSKAAANVLVRPRPGGALRAGFDGKSEHGSSAGARFGATSFGHLGFTGTSLWCEPTCATVVVLLTNRVYPTRTNIKIRQVRPELHGALFDLAQRITS